MSDPNQQDMPSFDSEYRPNFEELLAHIRNGTLGELTAGANNEPSIIFVDSRPRVEGEIWVNPDGAPVSSFMRKFKDGFEGWQPGEIVNARFVLTHKRGSRPGLLVSDAYIGDIRHADTFMLPEVSAEDDVTLRNLGMALIDADVEVTSPGTYRVSNMFDYEGRIHRINNVQMPWDGETEPQVGEQVLVQGEVVSYVTGEADYKNAIFPVVEVKLPNGRVVPIEMTNGNINYEAGNLDFLYPQDLREGDIVQINSTFSNASTWDQHRGRPATLHAPFCRSAYLLQPSTERLATYEAHRADIAARMIELGGLEGQAFRDAYARLMHDYIEGRTEQRHWPRLLLADQEQASLKALVDQKFPDDVEGNLSPDRPLTDFSHVWQMSEVSRGYGVDVYGMSRREFHNFCLDVASGRNVADPSLEISVDYPFWILSIGNEKFGDQEQFDVYRQTVEHWLPYIKGKEVVTRSHTLTDPERQVTFDNQYLAERATEFMVDSAERLPEARDYLYDLTTRTLREIALEDTSSSMWGYKLCSSLQRVLTSTGVWENYQCVGIKDPAGLSYFVEKLPELEDIARSLEANGKVYSANDILKLMAYISEFNTLPPYTNEAD